MKFQKIKKTGLRWKPSPVFALSSFCPPEGPLQLARTLIRSLESKPSIGFQYRADQGIIIIISLVVAKRELKNKSGVFPGNHLSASPFL
jgi:hypothetical protein